MTDKCVHIHADLSFCNNNNGYEMSVFCKDHYADINGNSRASGMQIKRLKRIRAIIKRGKEAGFIK